MRLIIITCLFVLTSLFACSRSNNVLLGRVEAKVGDHMVAVTDCYRTSAPSPQRLANSTDGKPVYRFTPCRDADVVIRGEELIVNGNSYGQLAQGDVVIVDHGKVLINDHEGRVTASR
jgi:hypothetical protein